MFSASTNRTMTAVVIDAIERTVSTEVPLDQQVPADLTLRAARVSRKLKALPRCRAPSEPPVSAPDLVDSNAGLLESWLSMTPDEQAAWESAESSLEDLADLVEAAQAAAAVQDWTGLYEAAALQRATTWLSRRQSAGNDLPAEEVTCD